MAEDKKIVENSLNTDKQKIKSESEEARAQIEWLKKELEWLQNISIGKEKIEKSQEILEKVKLLKWNEKVVGQRLIRLDTWLRMIIESPKNKEGIDIIKIDSEEINGIQEIILNLKRELKEIEDQSSALQRTLETLQKNKLSKWELETFKKIKNKEFLKLSPQERLRFITIGNISSEQVKTWKEKNLEFTFTYDGVFNRDFYIRTTIGQVLPEEVREVRSWSEVFKRSWISGEFFTESGKRLLIHEGTKVDIEKLATAEELEKLRKTNEEKVKEYKGNQNEDIAIEAVKRGIDPKFAISMYGESLKSLSGEARKVEIEDVLTDIARFQDDFSEEYPWNTSFEAWKVTESFAAYLSHILNKDTKAVATEFGFNINNFSKYKKQNRYTSGGPLKMEQINFEGVSKEEIDKILKMKKFVPGSKEAIVLFTVAAKAASLPAEWGSMSELHNILSHESTGTVGRLNYTIPKSMSTEEFKKLALSRRNNNPIGTTSTASWLGQLLLSNVDMYYPDGRNGIWDPLNEAVGMLRYIHSRYRNPKNAWALYGKTWSLPWVPEKTFKEWY